MINNFARFVALVLSCSSAYISILGMAIVFSGAYWTTIAIMIVLESAKVTTAAWLQFHWNDISRTIKTYLCSAVFILMCITSIGVYGFFARAHIEQQIEQETGDKSRLPLIEGKITALKFKLDDLNRQIIATDNTLKTLTDRSRTAKEAAGALTQFNRQKAARDKLIKEKDTLQEELIKLETDKSVLANQIKKKSVEVGPLKFLANFFYENAGDEQLERFVRWLIIIVVSVFDPLAIALIMATNSVSNRLRRTPSSMPISKVAQPKLKFKINT